MLSEASDRVLAAFGPLPAEERTRVLAHLRTMAEGSGWSPGQRRRAQAACAILERESRQAELGKTPPA